MPVREGSLEAPKRQPIDWQSDTYVDHDEVDAELERVFGICHGCRRCVSLCNAFPTLFDLVDDSDTLEVDGVDQSDYGKVVDECYLCDLCAETKCPYVPPHEWAVDFPHLMLRAKARKFVEEGASWRDRLIASTGTLFQLGSHPVTGPIMKLIQSNKPLRKLGERVAGIHAKAPLPQFERQTLDRRVEEEIGTDLEIRPGTNTTGKVAIYVTCYGNHSEPGIVQALIRVLIHNRVQVRILRNSECCGMAKLELGDLSAVAAQKNTNLPVFMQAIDDGYDLMSIVPSCTLMYRQEIPFMFPDDDDVMMVKSAFFDPFEFLLARYRDGLACTDFVETLGTVAYHAACHQRVQNIGQKTREFLSLVPDTEVSIIERCSGHDGTYAVKKETHEAAMKIARPVIRQVAQANANTYGSDCPMAGRLIQYGKDDGSQSEHPIEMLSRAYGLS